MDPCIVADQALAIRHVVMPDDVDCCVCTVLDWTAEHRPEVAVNVMDQYRPDNFYLEGSAKYRPRYTFDRFRPEGYPLLPGI